MSDKSGAVFRGEIALVLVRLNHITGRIVNANHSIV